MAENKVMVSAVPFEGHEQFYAAGFRFGTEPIEVKVVDPPSDAGPDWKPTAPYEITREQFDELKKTDRIKVEGEPQPKGQQQQMPRGGQQQSQQRTKPEGQ